MGRWSLCRQQQRLCIIIIIIIIIISTCRKGIHQISVTQNTIYNARVWLYTARGQGAPITIGAAPRIRLLSLTKFGCKLGKVV